MDLLRTFKTIPDPTRGELRMEPPLLKTWNLEWTSADQRRLEGMPPGPQRTQMLEIAARRELEEKERNNLYIKISKDIY